METKYLNLNFILNTLDKNYEKIKIDYKSLHIVISMLCCHY